MIRSSIVLGRPLDDPSASLPFIQTILQSLRLEIDTETTLIGFVGSPWTLAAYAMEGEGNKSLIHTKSIMFHGMAWHLHGIPQEAMPVYGAKCIDCIALCLCISPCHCISLCQLCSPCLVSSCSMKGPSVHVAYPK